MVHYLRVVNTINMSDCSSLWGFIKVSIRISFFYIELLLCVKKMKGAYLMNLEIKSRRMQKWLIDIQDKSILKIYHSFF